MNLRSIILPAILLALAGATLPLAAQPAFSEGEVRRVDRDNGKITLKHGEIKHIDMPPMTMVFSVKEPQMLDKLQLGDKVKFRVVNENGNFILTELLRAK